MTAGWWAWALALPVGLYALYIAAHAAGWHLAVRRYKRAQLPTPPSPPSPPTPPTLAVIVPARNEAANIQTNLPVVLGQAYPTYRVCVVDDDSEDDTAAAAHAIATNHLMVLPATTPGKKAALATGIAHSHSDWVVTTDADCRPSSPNWLVRLLASRSTQHSAATQCIVGPLRKTHGSGFSGSSLFGRIQALESAGLVGLAGGGIGLGMPTLANGANLAFSRSAFDAVGGYQGIDHVASGDDELLVHKIAARFGAGAIAFAAHADAIVDTPAERRLADLLRQRLRWVSKSRAYTNPFIRWGQVLAYVAYLALLALTVAACLRPGLWLLAASAWGVKLLAELSVLYPATALLRQRYLLWLLPLYQLPYVLYVLYIGVAGSFVKSYTWKGRRVQ